MKSHKELFDIKNYTDIDLERVDRPGREGETGLGDGESIVYFNKELEKVLKVFYLNYTLPYQGSFVNLEYKTVLEGYKKRHNYRSQKEKFIIDPRCVTRGDMIIHIDEEHYNVNNIAVSSLSLKDSKIVPLPENNVCILDDIPYVHGISLQSLCRKKNGPIFIEDSKDKREVKIGAEEIYRIGYQIADYINNQIYKDYQIYCGIIATSLTTYGHTGLVPKNIKFIGFDKETTTLNLEIVDRCSSIILWYNKNISHELFNNFIKYEALNKLEPTIIQRLQNTIYNLFHRRWR